MVSGIHAWDASRFEPFFRARCTSPEGRRLAAVIEQNTVAMVQACELERPAIAPLLAVIPDDLLAALNGDDGLMQAFGYMAALEMNVFGYRWKKGDSKPVRWPFTERTSQGGVMRRG